MHFKWYKKPKKKVPTTTLLSIVPPSCWEKKREVLTGGFDSLFDMH